MQEAAKCRYYFLSSNMWCTFLTDIVEWGHVLRLLVNQYFVWLTSLQGIVLITVNLRLPVIFFCLEREPITGGEVGLCGDFASIQILGSCHSYPFMILATLYECCTVTDTYSYGTVVTCSTSNEHEASATPYLSNVFFKATKEYFIFLKVNTTSHGIHHRIWLFKNFFLHKGAVVPCEKSET